MADDDDSGQTFSSRPRVCNCMFAPGQTYVALSRIRSLEGLHLTRPLRPSDIIVDDNVRRFMADVEPLIGRAVDGPAA